MRRILTHHSPEDLSVLGKVCQPAGMEEGVVVAKNLIQTAKACKKPKAAGLAANQIGSSLRICAIKYAGLFVPMINPELSDLSDDTVQSFESCLSRPGLDPIEVTRHKTVTVTYTNPKGNEKTLKLRGQESICLQHEVDHLNGILI